MRRRATPRTLYAAMLLVAALAALLVAWFVSGWSDVRAQQRELAAAPAREAAERGGELAHELRGELAQLMTREVERPYFHYQNLMHDPRAGATLNVSPSPLASGPADPLVLGYFQIDAAGKVSTPPINDDIPALSEQKRLAANVQFRDEVARGIVASVRPVQVAARDRGTLVASAAQPPPPRPAQPQAVPRPVPQPQPQPRVPAPVPEPEQAQAQVVEIDESSYTQNAMPTEVYRQQNAGPRVSRRLMQQQASPPPQQQASPPPQQATPLPPQQATPPMQQQAAPPPHQANPPSQQQMSPLPQQQASPPVQQASPPPQQQASPPPQQQASPPPPQQASPPPQQQMSLPPQQASSSPQQANPPVQQQASPPAQQASSPPPKPRLRAAVKPPPPPTAEPEAPVMITISPLEWRTLPYGGRPSLVAVRHVDTPDANLAQGFVIDRASVTSWLASRAGDAVAEIVAEPEASKRAHAAEIAPGWYLDVSASPHATAAAATAATAVANGFLLRFVIVGVIAMIAAALVVLLVSRAERLARERSQFAAAAAHELRTPLAGLQLYGDMLADGLGDPAKMRDYARRMSEEASRLGRVVSNVLGFSQLERGNLSVEARSGNLGAALCELAERAQPALDRAGAVLDLDVPPELSARFDRDALARIVGNLLDNAEKYGRDAEDRTIRLAAREAGDRVEVEVTDHGPGVAPAARGKLFRAFSRGVSADGPAGLGLGLALSQSLARAMGGDLEHRPGAERGATFVLRLAKP